MKRTLISLSVLVTLSQTYHNTDNHLYLRTGGQHGDVLQNNAENEFIKKYLVKKSASDEIDAKIAKEIARKSLRARDSNERVNDYRNIYNRGSGEHLKWSYQMDPILNQVRRVGEKTWSDSGSSSREFKDWKEEWRELWRKRKAETKNFSTQIDGDFVNMVAARPWGVPCGDPSQHDMPWGSCVLSVECNAEYRIYKGDYFCGRTQFVCCSLNFHTYDLYEGLDASFQQSSMEIDSALERERAKKKTPKERQKRSERRRKRRKRLREERKRKIKRTITKIVKEVHRVLNKAYKNGSKIRKKKTNTMKKFIKALKRQYKLDRESAKDIHEQQMMEVDQAFMNKLMQIKDLNADFMTNDTFRNIIVNHTVSLRTAKMLAQAYPELADFLPEAMFEGDYTRVGKGSARRRGDSRQRGDSGRRWQPSRLSGSGKRLKGGVVRPRTRRNRRKYLDYDVEYGLMYS